MLRHEVSLLGETQRVFHEQEPPRRYSTLQLGPTAPPSLSQNEHKSIIPLLFVFSTCSLPLNFDVSVDNPFLRNIMIIRYFIIL